MKRLALVSVFLLLFVPLPALADTIDFNAQNLTGVTWSWGGMGTPLTATGDSVQASPVPPNGSSVLLDLLTFTTGNASGTGTLAGQTFTIFDPSGSSVGVSSDPLDTLQFACTSNVCFTGQFVSAQLLGGVGTGDLSFIATFVLGTLDAALLDALNLPSDITTATGTLTATLSLDSGLTFDGEGCLNAEQERVTCTGSFGSADLQVTTVPEPGTVTLLGTGVLALAGFLRRKFRS